MQPWLAPAEPREVGLSRPHLERLDATFQAAVDRRDIPGAVLLVGRRGRVAWHAALGFLDREAGVPMSAGAIFRIASMSKPFAALAAMMLVEEGALRLDMPVEHYLPMLKNLKVARPRADGSLELTPPQRLPTVLDLLRHTSGFVNGHLGISPVKKLYAAAGIMAAAQLPRADYLATLASLPLEYEPGTTFGYGVSADLLMHIVENLSGSEADAVVRTRITGPLGMKDTAFELPAADWNRVAQPQIDPVTGKRRPMRETFGRPVRFSTNGNMLATALDYGHLCQFLLERGTAGGVRLMSRKTIEMMTVDQLPAGCAFDREIMAAWGPGVPSPEWGQSFGLGFAVRIHPGRAPWHGSLGEFGWMGGGGTYFWIDPREELFAILMSQTGPTEMVPLIYLIRSGVYAALAD